MVGKTFEVKGRPGMGIIILSRCPICGIFKGLAGASKIPSNFNNDHVLGVTPEDLAIMPEKNCGRLKCATIK